jgi:hypothetical protein
MFSTQFSTKKTSIDLIYTMCRAEMSLSWMCYIKTLVSFHCYDYLHRIDVGKRCFALHLKVFSSFLPMIVWQVNMSILAKKMVRQGKKSSIHEFL